MLKNLFKNEKTLEFFRFFINGAICFVIDWCIMMLLMKFTSLPDWFSIGVGFLVSVIVNYLICIYWVFNGVKKQNLVSKIVFISAILSVWTLLSSLFICIVSVWVSFCITTILLWEEVESTTGLVGPYFRFNLGVNWVRSREQR